MSKNIKSGYQSMETHKGLPLSYVSEKLSNSIISQHRLISSLRLLIPKDFKSDKLSGIPEPVNIKNDYFISPALTSFYYQINSFLALQNKLGVLNNELVEELLGKSSENLQAWLTRFEFIHEV